MSNKTKNISILGATGSIGKSALKICDQFKDCIKIIALSANSNVKSLLSLIDRYKPEYAVISDQNQMEKYFGYFHASHNGVKIYSGVDGIKKICSDKSNEIIINGISGKAGLMPSIEVVKSGINLACANKESIVCAGPLLKNILKTSGSMIIPVDSEHSALFHLLKNKDINDLKNIYLTASGGPFLNLDKSRWHKITIEDALKHPTWKMGNKITIDSATMANKGLEVIEAHYLFDVEYSKIKVLIHPQSLIHSMIETNDCELYAQLGPNDMSIPIQNAVFYPKIMHNLYNKFDFTRHVKLDLYPVDLDKYRMLKFAYLCGERGNKYTSFYNFINEALVNMFLQDKISFLDIENYMEVAIEKFDKDCIITHNNNLDLDEISVIERYSENIIKKIIKD
jgi:1-deoxy-D-xylulose-5-phosphate reductoisomerase